MLILKPDQINTLDFPFSNPKGTLLLRVLHGSRSYGTHNEDSDFDYKGIFICHPLLKILDKSPEQFEENKDSVVYELNRFISLVKTANPTLLEILFTDPQNILFIRKEIQPLLEAKKLFLTKTCQASFCGYALSQLKRIKTHKQWLMNPILIKPERETFYPKGIKKIDKNIYDALNSLPEEEKVKESDYILQAFYAEKTYQNAMKQWQQYNEWKTSRNPARAELEAKFGYDAKHAMHLIRLLRMGLEIATDKDLKVLRPDADYLKEVRAGLYSYEEVVEKAENLLEQVDIAYTNSNLPLKVDESKLIDLILKISIPFFQGAILKDKEKE